MKPCVGEEPENRDLPELLAPAGSPEALRAAIAAGADAVYLSGKQFGARKFAANFSDEEIAEAVRFAHARDVRVYVTVNTLVHDRELESVAGFLVRLYETGADAVLVQDAGVAALAREIVPGLTLHASTQMTVHNTPGVLEAAARGFSRVVLARELSLDAIRRIRKSTVGRGTGLEVFVHGALCYSYSGQCLLSSVIGGRSGNRGMCAQPCRKPYTLVTGRPDQYGRPEDLRELETPGRFLLSPRDLCTYRDLPALVGAGIDSLKIEGRMKSPEYVAIVVSTYRQALDAIAAGTFRPDPRAEQDLLLAFNRGFTRGYIAGDRHGRFMGRDAPDNRGICIGTVTRQDSRTGEVTVRLSGSLVPEPGDGLFFCDPAGRTEGRGFQLNNTPVREKGSLRFTAPVPAAPGSLVSITSRRELETRARKIAAGAFPARRVPVDLAVRVDDAGRISMEGRIGARGIPVPFTPELTLVPARSRPVTREQLEAQIRKTGDTQFEIRHLVLTYDGTRFAPVGDLNRLRRDFLSRAEEALTAAAIPRPEAAASARERLNAAFSGQRNGTAPARAGPAITETVPRLTVIAGSEDEAAGALGAGCTSVWFEPCLRIPRHTCDPAGGPGLREQVTGVMTRCREAGARFVLMLPVITPDDLLDGILPDLQQLSGEGLEECMAGTAGAAAAIRSALPGMILSGGTGLNVFNHRSACALSGTLRSLTLSPELSGAECRELIGAARAEGCTGSFALVVQGITDAMVTEDCLLEPVRHCRPSPGEPDRTVHGIRDETGRVFPVMTDGSCRTRIGNAVELSLIDQLPAIRHAGIDEIVIDARSRTGAYAGEMTRIWKIALQQAGPAGAETAVLRERVRALARGGITAGHFLRGLKE